MDASKLSTLPLAEQAAYWHRVLKDEPTPEHHAAFEAWKSLSARHVAEFQLAREVEERLLNFHSAHHVDVDLLIQRARREQWIHRMRLLAALIVVGLSLSAGVMIFDDKGEVYATRQQQQLIHLEDGSVVALNVQSEMRVVFSEDARDLYLQGQGIFRVRPEANRPFRVHAGPAVVEALGTQFDVQTGTDQATVAVVEGVVKLTSRPSIVRVLRGNLALTKIPKIEEGESATLREDGGTEGVRPIDVAKATSWRLAQEKLVFNNIRLAEIADAFNRYNAAPKLTIEGEGLRNRRYLINFKSANPKLLLKYLEDDKTLEFIKNGDDVIVRERNR